MFRVIGLNIACLDLRMTRMVEWNIVGCCTRVRYAEANDLTHTTGRKSIMSFHAHDHGHCRDVAEGNDKIRTKGEEFRAENIKCSNTNSQAKEFLDHKPQE